MAIPFEQGDLVTWIESFDDRRSNDTLYRLKAEFGEGPFTLSHVERAKFTDHVHPNLVRLEGFPNRLLSGAFFRRTSYASLAEEYRRALQCYMTKLSSEHRKALLTKLIAVDNMMGCSSNG